MHKAKYANGGRLGEDLIEDEVNILGASIDTVGAGQELLIKLLETAAFVVCDVIMSIYWPAKTFESLKTFSLVY